MLKLQIRKGESSYTHPGREARLHHVSPTAYAALQGTFIHLEESIICPPSHPCVHYEMPFFDPFGSPVLFDDFQKCTVSVQSRCRGICLITNVYTNNPMKLSALQGLLKFIHLRWVLKGQVHVVFYSSFFITI